jgi:hypothetical protein
MPCEREYTPYNNPDSFASAGRWASAQRGIALENTWAAAHAQSPPSDSDWQTYHRVDTGKGIADFLHKNDVQRRFFFEDLHATQRANYNGPFGPTTVKHDAKTQDKYANSPLAEMYRESGYEQLPSGDSNPLTLN